MGKVDQCMQCVRTALVLRTPLLESVMRVVAMTCDCMYFRRIVSQLMKLAERGQHRLHQQPQCQYAQHEHAQGKRQAVATRAEHGAKG